MTVHWTSTAERHLTAIHDYIAGDSEHHARETVDRITARTQQIALFPLSGRALPEGNVRSTREVIEGSYRIIYRVRVDQIEVLAVLHTRQRFPRGR